MSLYWSIFKKSRHLGLESISYLVHDSCQVLHRVFPFYRGLFEDKVGNVWCALDMLLKLRANLRLQQLTRLCLLSTLTFRQLAASCLYK
jgi:hypothetical protein